MEDGIRPNKIFATAFNESNAQKGVRFIRPIHPYPLLSRYMGGDPLNPDNYEPVEHDMENM